MDDKRVQTIRIGHLNIVDHLILGVAVSSSGLPGAEQVDIRPVPTKTWGPLCRGLETGELDGALINIPLAMDLFGAGLDIVLVMFSHRGGSRLVGRNDMARPGDFAGKSLLIPHRLSVQHLLMHKFMTDQNLTLDHGSRSLPEGAIMAEAVPMALMPEMAADDPRNLIAGFISSDPFGSLAVELGTMKPFLTSQELWKDHPCCGLVIHRRHLDTPDAVSGLVRMMFGAAAILDTELASADGPGTEILSCAAAFLDQPHTCTRQALTRSGVTYKPELLIPAKGPLDIIQQYMVSPMGLLSAPVCLDDFIFPHFAQNALSELSR